MPYNELGDYVPGDETISPADMRKELLSAKLKQMVNSPANDITALVNKQNIKDTLGAFGSAGESMVRGAGSAILGGLGDMFDYTRKIGRAHV